MRAALGDALAALDAQLPLRVPVLIGGERRDGRGARLHRPGRRPTASWRWRAAPPRPRSTHAVEPRPRARARAGARGRPPSARAALVGAAGAAARAPPRARRARGARVREAVGRGRRRRLRGDRLPRVLRARRAAGAGARARRCSSCRASATRCATRRAASRRDRAVELPARRSRAGWPPAALATGNAVVLKPAEQSPGCALAVVEALRAARRAARRGRAAARARATTGAALVRHPGVAHDRLHRLGGRRARRSSRRRRESPGQRHLKRVVAEMGGKNCVIVDADADLDEAVPAHRRLGLRLRGPEVLGRLARARPRGDRRRRCSSAWPARSRRCGRPGRRASASTSRR